MTNCSNRSFPFSLTIQSISILSYYFFFPPNLLDCATCLRLIHVFFSYRAGCLSCCTVDILGQIILGGRDCPGHCRKFSGILALDSQDASSTPPDLASCDNQNVSRYHQMSSVQFSPVTWSCPTVCDPMDCSTQASLSITNSWSMHKRISIKLVMPSNHLIFCHPLLFLLSVFPSIRVFSNESVLRIRWPKYWSFSFSI